MVLHAAFGGSTNLLLHTAGDRTCGRVAHGPRSRMERVNRSVPRLVEALPNGPRNIPRCRYFWPGGVPEVMLHLRRAGLLRTKALTVSGDTWKWYSIGGNNRIAGGN